MKATEGSDKPGESTAGAERGCREVAPENKATETGKRSKDATAEVDGEEVATPDVFVHCMIASDEPRYSKMDSPRRPMFQRTAMFISRCRVDW